ncbi:MAG: hypothetical protein LBB48_05165 [Treponema sp.]|nr:hypothetical protein [Treponema sp.]
MSLWLLPGLFFLVHRLIGWPVLGIRAIGGIFHGLALQAAIPLLVPKKKLIAANSVNEFILVGSYILGSIIGAAMFAALPMKFILLTDILGAMFACAAVMLGRVHTKGKKGKSRKSK